MNICVLPHAWNCTIPWISSIYSRRNLLLLFFFIRKHSDLRTNSRRPSLQKEVSVWYFFQILVLVKLVYCIKWAKDVVLWSNKKKTECKKEETEEGEGEKDWHSFEFLYCLLWRFLTSCVVCSNKKAKSAWPKLWKLISSVHMS